MYKNLKEQLLKSNAESQFVIAVNVDIRGFTDFCRRSKDAEVSLFLQTIYLRITSEYFPTVEFCKPTGDGLMIVIPYQKESFSESMNSVLTKCIELLDSFDSFCKDDDNIYFPVPDKIGIGISRGCSCCIKANGTIIDYSGQVLNVASRLMDIARPKGIIVENNFDINTLDGDYAFGTDSVYLTGVAEREPVNIYYQKDDVTIKTFNKHPIGVSDWKTIERKIQYKEIAPFETYSITLEGEPYSEGAIVIQTVCPDKRTGTRGDISSFLNKEDWELKRIGDTYIIYFKTNSIKQLIDEEMIDEDDVVRTIVIYPI